jgi:hypothetical protein
VATDDFKAQQDQASKLLAGLIQRSSEAVKPLNEDAPIKDVDVAGLPAAIQQIRERGGKAFAVRRKITDLVHKTLCTVGFFSRGDGDLVFFFSDQDHLLYDLNSKRFEQLLANASGLNQTEPEFTFVQTHLQNVAALLPLTPIYSRSYYDWNTGRFHMSNGLGGQYIRDRGGEWRFAPNGEDVLFLTEHDNKPWSLDPLAKGEELQEFIESASLGDDGKGNLTVDDQRALLLAVLLFLLFTRSTKPLVVGNGAKGSGKTSFFHAVGVLLRGGGFKVTGSMVDKPAEDMLVALSNDTVVVADNFDSYIKGIEDLLAIYSTGGVFKKRALYTDNSMFETVLRAILFITTRGARFNRDDVADRTIPLYFKKPAMPIGESVFRERLLLHRDAIMSGLLVKIGEIADRLGQIEHIPARDVRLADFAAFGWVLFAKPEGDHWSSPEWDLLLEKLKLAQHHFTARGNNIVAALRGVLEREHITKMSTGALFDSCRSVAEVAHIQLPKTAQGFGHELTNLKFAIEAELEVVFTEEHGHGGKRFITLTPKRADMYFQGRPACEHAACEKQRGAATAPLGLDVCLYKQRDEGSCSEAAQANGKLRETAHLGKLLDEQSVSSLYARSSKY